MPRLARLIRRLHEVFLAIAGAVRGDFQNLSGARDGKAKNLGSDECRAGSLGRPCHRAHAAGRDREAHGHFRNEAQAFREEVTFRAGGDAPAPARKRGSWLDRLFGDS